MSKNLTRKGLAIGAIVALGTSLFAAAPAHAITSAVSLAPTLGDEYNVTAGSTFSLDSNFGNVAKSTGSYLKFLVQDPNSYTTASSTTSGRYSATSDATGTTTTLVFAAATNFNVGDYVDVKQGATTTTVALTAVSVDKKTITFVATTGIAAAIASTVSEAADTHRAADKSYVINTGSDTNGATHSVQIKSTAADTTQSVTVTAWVDLDGNGKIDPTTEYASAPQVVSFLKNSDITPNVSFAPVAVGTDSTVTANVTFTPALNGSELTSSYNSPSAAGSIVNAKFTRPGSISSLASASTSYSNDTKIWSVTSTNMNTGWGITQPTASLEVQSVKIASNVVTVTTSAGGYATANIAAHNLQVGDTVAIAATTTAGAVNATAKVLSVPTSTTFTYAVAAGLQPATDVAATTQATGTIANGTILRNFAVAGDYTAQVQLYKNDGTTNALTALGSAVSSSATTATAVTVGVDGVPSATVSKSGNVKTGTTTANAVVTVLDKDGNPVAAGIQGSVTVVSNASGAVTVNGTTIATTGSTVIYGTTNAAGQIPLAITNASALKTDSITIAPNVQGVTRVGGAKTIQWADATYTIVDLNDQNDDQSGAGDAFIAVVKGGTAVLHLAVLDQYNSPIADGYRLAVTASGRAATNQFVTLTAGKADVTVGDSGIDAATDTLSINIQKATSGVWATSTTTAAQVQKTISYYSQTDVITLNADGANLPSTVTAIATASTTTAALVAFDGRTATSGAAPAVVAAGKAVISGNVAGSVSGVGKKGAIVSFTGAGLLFHIGDVWSIGSASAVAFDGTFSVEVYSSTPGVASVVITEGAVTKTAKVTYSGAAAADAAILKATAGATTIQAGRAVDYTVLVTDKNGLLVKGFVVKATVSGAGSFAGSAAADGSVSVTTDATGKAIVKVLYSSNDQGTATVTFADPTTGTTIASAAVSTEVGSTDANIDIVNNRVTAVASFSKGKTVAFYVDGLKKWSKTSASDADVVLNYNLKKGTHTVTVKISGGFVTTEKFIVK